MEYEYYQVYLDRDRTAHKALAARLHAAPEIVAVFSPLLGFASTEALVLAKAGADLGLTPIPSTT